MAIKTTKWRPDTCGCELEYTWNSDDPPETRIHTASRVIKACPVHRATRGDPVAHLASVLAENQKKNRGFAAVVKALPTRNVLEAELGYRFDPLKRARIIIQLPATWTLTGSERTSLNEALQEVSPDLSFE